MQFKDLEWKDIISDSVVVCSHCEINLCGWIKIHHFTTFSKIKERTRRFLMYNKFANKSTRKRVTLYV